jgi:hypothetical protein
VNRAGAWGCGRHLLSNPEAGPTLRFSPMSKKLRLGDEKITSQLGRFLVAAQAHWVAAASHSGLAAMRVEHPSITTIIGHNSEESLATATSTGVASRATQLFAGGLGVALASAFEPERNR